MTCVVAVGTDLVVGSRDRMQNHWRMSWNAQMGMGFKITSGEFSLKIEITQRFERRTKGSHHDMRLLQPWSWKDGQMVQHSLVVRAKSLFVGTHSLASGR